jgi:Double zinc ribbon
MVTNFCRVCGANIHPANKFCTKCGTQVNIATTTTQEAGAARQASMPSLSPISQIPKLKFCKKCNRKVSLDGKFCASCGADLSGASGDFKQEPAVAYSSSTPMKRKMSWVTIGLIIWLAIRTIVTIIGLPSNLELLDSSNSILQSVAQISVVFVFIVLTLYAITIVGIYLHYTQKPSSTPIRWGPIAGLIAVGVDVFSMVVMALMLIGYVNSYSSYYYNTSSASAMIAGMVIGSLFWNGILAALLYGEYKKEGQVERQATVLPG